MRRSAAGVATAAFFVVAPGTVAGLIPWLITRWDIPGTSAPWRVAQILGTLLIVVGLIPVVHAFVEFVKAGGTPMPIAPTQRLVVDGFNRYVRNPMYVGVVLVIVGQALVFGSLGLLLYAAIVWTAFASFVHLYEEPVLGRQYGSEYQEYRWNVRGWVPRWRPWMPGGQPQPSD